MIRLAPQRSVLFFALALVFGAPAKAGDAPPLVAVHGATKDSPSGAVTLLDADSYALLGTVPVKGDPWSVYHDPSGKRLAVLGASPSNFIDGQWNAPWSMSVLDVAERANSVSVDVGLPPIVVASDTARSRQYILGGGEIKSTFDKRVETSSLLTVLDLATREAVASAKTAPGGMGLWLSPSGRRLHVLHGADTPERKGLPSTIVVHDAETLAVLKEVPLTRRAFAMALGPDDKTLYVLSTGEKPKKKESQPALCVIDVETGDVLAQLDVGYKMLGLTVDRHRGLVYVLGSDAKGHEGLVVVAGAEIKGRVALDTGYHGIRFAPGDDAVLVLGWEAIYQIDPSKPSIARKWPLDFQPADILFDAARKRAYVNAVADSEVAELDLENGKVLASHKTGNKAKKAGMAFGSALLGMTTGVVVYGRSATQMVLRADGRVLYVINELTDDLTIVDTITHKIVRVISTGRGTRRVVLPPAGDYLYVEAADKLSGVSTSDNRVVEELPLRSEATPRGGVTYDLVRHRAFIPKGSVVDVLDLGSGTTTTSIQLALPASVVIVPSVSTDGNAGPPEPPPAPAGAPPPG